MLFFAYGSSMDWAQMKARCKSAEYVCLALLPNYRLAFPRKSKNGYGTAGVIPSKGGVVWGVVYQITKDDMRRLDTREGYWPGDLSRVNSYVRARCHVFVNGERDKRLTTWTYYAVAQSSEFAPNAEYLNHIVSGAIHWKLPREYIDRLAAIETREVEV
ncbi:MAG: gamma-glutamylcyclotransferase [Chloroflexi bacterium]|nr:gamma-glutamylcyclotransferase [Chloroflexota bacterium]MCL5274407.1 gamma-glutamylcyclotransferase [Chloroflexota bacterium]